MIRALVEQTFDQYKKYFVLAGSSQDTKPTAGVVTGSKFLEVDTGTEYAFDEASNEWIALGLTPEEAKAAIADEVSDWLDAHPEATTTVEDGAITYAKLDASLQGSVDDVSSLKSALQSDESTLYTLYRQEYTIKKTNTSFSLAGKAVGDTLDLTPMAATNFGYIIIPCKAGESFLITANAGSGNYPWACLDANNVILSIAGTASVSKETVIAPTNTANFVVRANCNSAMLIIRGKGIVNALNGEEKIMSIDVVNGYWTSNGSAGGGLVYRKTENSIFYRAGTTFKIYATATNTATTGALMTEWDASGNFIQTLVGYADVNVQTVYTLDHDAYIRFSYYNSYGFNGAIVTPTSSEVMSAVGQTRESVTGAMYEWERVLNAVCCIGDSLTRGAYFVNGHDGSAIDQNYPYFFGKQTGLTVQNEGMSGSSPSSRWSYFSTYDFTPYNAFFIWWGTNGGLTDTLATDGVIDGSGNLIADYTTYADTNTGDYCKVIGRIIQQVPHAKIFLATIYTTSGDRDVTNDVIEKIAALYPDNVMGVVDCNDGTLYTLSSKKLTPSWVHIDNAAHFSMVGNYYLAVHWIKAVRAIIAANPARFENLMEDILAQ